MIENKSFQFYLQFTERVINRLKIQKFSPLFCNQVWRWLTDSETNLRTVRSKHEKQITELQVHRTVIPKELQVHRTVIPKTIETVLC